MSIKALGGLLIAIFAIMALAWWQGWIAPPGANLDVPKDSDARNTTNTPPSEEGIVKSIIDPITIELESGHIIRYIGVRSPSVEQEVHCFGKEALLANESMVGKKIRIEEEPLLARSSDGAWTRYVFFEEESSPEPAASTAPTEETVNDISPDLEALADVAKKQISGDALQVMEEGQDQPSTTPASETMADIPDEAIDEGPDEVFVNERILEGGFGFPVVSEDMVYGERMLSAARFASATGKGLWSRCDIDSEQQPLQTQVLEECIIKGKVTNKGEKLYRTPDCPGYQQTIPIQIEGGAWFCAEDIATDAGFTKAPDCP